MHLIESKVLYLQNYSKNNHKKQLASDDHITVNFNESLADFLKIRNINRTNAISYLTRFDKPML